MSQVNLQNTQNKSAHILIVDDEEVLRELFKVILEKSGYSVTAAKSGNEAWDELLQNSIDLVISDVRMPDGDGLSLLERIRKKSPEHPVILVTGYADIDEDEALARGATAIFSKPFDYEIFLQTVREVVARIHSTRTQ